MRACSCRTAGTSSVDVAVLTVPTRTIGVSGQLVAGRGAQPVDGLEHLDHVLLQLAALAADSRPGATAVQEGHAELALQLGDRLAQRGLRDVQLLAGAAQRPVLGDGREVLELFDPHW